ncbi:MAG: hypothetical protein M3308_04710, partial [Actinomycetota bacterium]|nr:hypothetical protein [Actinomycetota bacterium]
LGQVAVQTDLSPSGVNWAVVSFRVTDAPPPRGPLVARLVDTLRARVDHPVDDVLAAVRSQCATLGRRVRARLIPVGPRGIVVEGMARDLDDTGSLVVESGSERLQAVRPQDLGWLEER